MKVQVHVLLRHLITVLFYTQLSRSAVDAGFMTDQSSLMETSVNGSQNFAANALITGRRLLASSATTISCDSTVSTNSKYKRYFDDMNLIYDKVAGAEGTCFPVHKKCGWPSVYTNQKSPKKLPLFVVSVGLEGAGHHLWTEIMDSPIFDCVWTNARHYRRNIADGVPRTTAGELAEGIQEQFRLRVAEGYPACERIYDAEDSFPTGAIRKSGRIFCRPDLVNIQKLDGVLYHAKYLIIVRNVTVSVHRANYSPSTCWHRL
jgi:hypothetical protein